MHLVNSAQWSWRKRKQWSRNDTHPSLETAHLLGKKVRKWTISDTCLQALRQPPEGYAAISDADAQIFGQYRGFVILEMTGGIVTACTGNQAALDAYLAEYPDPVPELDKPDELTDLQELTLDLAVRLSMLENGVTDA